ncbi:hypothetical protein H4582DRAFT_1499709 [Lactarius indigo]|nr:hypothetical protein H4582DRAFT_1499709 [Lactarius indigo]
MARGWVLAAISVSRSLFSWRRTLPSISTLPFPHTDTHRHTHTTLSLFAPSSYRIKWASTTITTRTCLASGP